MKDGKSLEKYKNAVMLIISILLANCFVFLQYNWKMNPIIIVGVVLIFYLAISYLWKNRNELRHLRMSVGSVFISILFSLMMVIGRKISTESIEFQPFVLSDIFLLLFYFATAFILLSALFVFCTCNKPQKIISDRKAKDIDTGVWMKYSLFLALTWIPILIIYYPGIVPEDAKNSIGMIMGIQPWSNHFPVFYILIVGSFIKLGTLLGNINLGVALYSLCQLLIMALIIGYFLTWMSSKGVRRVFLYLSIAYFSAMPLFGNYAIVMWKDPYFSGVLLLLVLFLYDCVVEERHGF